jgi:hypothetical protein
MMQAIFEVEHDCQRYKMNLIDQIYLCRKLNGIKKVNSSV